MAHPVATHRLTRPGADWQTVLAQMSREARMPFADAALAAMETAVVADVQTATAHWWRRWMPWALTALAWRWTPAVWQTWLDRTPLFTAWEPAWTTAWQHAWDAGQQAATPSAPSPASPPRSRPAPRDVRGPGSGGGGGASGPRPPRPPVPLLPYRQAQEAAWLAEQTAALQMREWATGMQAAVRRQVVTAVQNRWTADQLTGALADQWRLTGVQARRIAVTELNAAYSGGLLLAVPEGTAVWIAPIGDAKVCPECKRLLEGRVFTVRHRPPAHPTKYDRETSLWPAKTNRGVTDRHAWDPCTPLHPFCRHVPQSWTTES